MKINNPNNSNPFKKKKINTNINTNKTSKSKSKSKHKSKQKKFNPLQYLNALIQLTQTNSYTTKKRKNSAKRDLSSALTLATPALQKTISTSKVRSKSSYSQYRKKTISGLKQVLQVNLESIITQQDNIKFTQNSDQSNLLNLAQSMQIRIKQIKKQDKKIDYNYYARKIQRAWRNYQTLNVVNKYYDYFRKLSKKQKKKQKQVRQQQLQKEHLQQLKNSIQFNLQRKSQQNIQKIIVTNSESRCSQHVLQKLQYLQQEKSKQLQKTQRIKNQNFSNTIQSSIVEQQLNSTAKKVLVNKIQKETLSIQQDGKKNQQNLNKQMNQNSSQKVLKQRNYLIDSKQNSKFYLQQSEEQIQKLKQKETQKFNQALKIIKKNEKTSQQILKELMEKFQFNKKALQQQTYQRFNQISLESQQMKKSKSISSSEQNLKQNQKFKINEGQNNSQKQFLSFNSNQAISSQFSSPNDSRPQQVDQTYQKQYKNNQFIQNQQEYNKCSQQKFVNKKAQFHESSESKLQSSGKSFQKYQGLDQINLLQEMSDSSQSEFYNNAFDPINNTHKLFYSRLKVLTLKSEKQIQEVQKLTLNQQISQQKAVQKKEQIQGRFQRQKRKIQKSKIKYYTALKQVKNQAIYFQRDILKLNSTQQYKLPIRKCFSAQSIILKCIISQPQILNFDIQDFQDEAIQQKLLEGSEQNSKIIINGCQSEASYFDKDYQHIKKCSQEIQKIIQKQLIIQIVSQIYMNQSLFKYFKPFVQEVFQFSKITDCSIVDFTKNVCNFVQNKQIINQRMNQKINPSSLQILRLIRDYQYQIEEYQLILPQQSFKLMRKDIENDYCKKIKQKQKLTQPIKQLDDLQLVNHILIKQNQKRLKIQRYLNFQRDLKIMYMKSVFNCLNQFLIQEKSMQTFMNSRSSIGPGELTLSIKEFNNFCDQNAIKKIFLKSQQKVQNILINKCMMPTFRNYQQIQLFQNQMAKILRIQLDQSEFKWVNFMDEVLQIWNDLSIEIVSDIFSEAAKDLNKFLQLQ